MKVTVLVAYLLATFVHLFVTNLTVQADDIYVAGYGNWTLSKIDPNGNRTTLADYTDGLRYPQGIALGPDGYVYVGDFNKILKFDPSGNGSVFAESLPGTGLAFDRFGSLFVANANGFTIEKLDANGGRFVFADSSDGLQFPQALAFDANGNLYVANGNNSIIKFDAGGNGSVFAASGLDHPQALAFDRGGNLFAANFSNNTIQKFDPNGNRSVFANSGLNGPAGLAFDNIGNLFVANYFDGTILKFDAAGHGSIFTSGLFNPMGIAIPEPTTGVLLGLWLGLVLIRQARRCPQH